MKTIIAVVLALLLATAVVRVGSHELKARGGCPVIQNHGVHHAALTIQEPRVILAQNDQPYPQPDGYPDAAPMPGCRMESR